MTEPSARQQTGQVNPVIRFPESLDHEAFLNVVIAARLLLHDVAEIVKAQGLTEPQFNALRILRGAGPHGLPCSSVAERMITRVPDMTRLVDRLERMGLAERRRDAESDRRVIRVVLTPRGRALLRKLDGPIRNGHRDQFGHLSKTELRELVRLLEKVRAR